MRHQSNKNNQPKDSNHDFNNIKNNSDFIYDKINRTCFYFIFFDAQGVRKNVRQSRTIPRKYSEWIYIAVGAIIEIGER